VLAAGKLAGVLGATGQGTFSDAAWATAYRGPGPWGSLAAEVPSHPSQAYEALAVAISIAVLAVISRARVFARRDGAVLFVAVGLWALARVAVASTWRDPVAVGPLRMEQALALALLAVSVVGFALRARRPMPLPREARVDAEAHPA
jgi:prolipoprotein diacylglyceryltransferase